MRIERHYTEANANPYDAIAFAAAKSEIRNPDGSVVFSADGLEVPAVVEPGGGRRAGAEIFPQGGRPGAAEARRGERRSLVPVALRARRGGAGGFAEG